MEGGEHTAATRTLIDGVTEMRNARAWDRIDELFAPDVVLHAPLATEPRHGRDEVRALFEERERAIPDLHVSVVETVVEGGEALVRATISGTHSGELGGFKPSGRAFEGVEDGGWYSVSGGQISEVWVLPTELAILEALGQVPSGPPPRLLAALMRLRNRGTRDLPPVRPVFEPPPQRVPGEYGGELKHTVRRGQMELVEAERWELADEILTDDYSVQSKVDHVFGRDASRALYQKVKRSLPDLHFTREVMIAEGNLVGIRVIAHATHGGPLEGFPPTGRRYDAPELFIYELREGLVARQWHFVNFESMLKQLGLVPEGPPPLPLRLLLKLFA